MQRYRGVVIAGWPAILLAPILLPIAVLGGLFGGKEKRSAADVAGYLSDFISGTGGEWDWDDFVCTPIADPELDRIRREAAGAGPPDPEMGRLRELLAEAEAIDAATPHPSASG